MDSDMSVLNQFFILRISGVSYLDRDYRSPLISQSFECTRRTFGSFDSFATTKTLFIYNHVTLFLILLVKVEFLKKCLHGQTKPKIILIWSKLHIVQSSTSLVFLWKKIFRKQIVSDRYRETKILCNYTA